MSDEEVESPAETDEQVGSSPPPADESELDTSVPVETHPDSPGPGWWKASDGQWYPPESRHASVAANANAADQGQSSSPNLSVSTERKTPDERKARLAQTITGLVAGGARVESQSDYQAVLVKGKNVNHVLQLILTLVTCGLWAIVWIVLAITEGEKRSIASVDDFGNVIVQRMG